MSNSLIVSVFGIVWAAVVALMVPAAAADTLPDVQKRGFLRCGITESGPGFSYINAAGQRVGFEIDHCNTVAAAVFGAIKVEYVIATPQTAFTLLQAGSIDVFPAGATWSFLRDTSLGLSFAGVYFFDGQGFMVRENTDVHKVADLDGATICVLQGTTLEQNLADYFENHGITYAIITFSDADKALEAYQADRCDAITMQRAALATRASSLRDRAAHKILAEVISREPQGPLVRQDDARWRTLVLWVFNVRVAAEELGISQANVERLRRETSNREIQRLLGVYGGYGRVLGLSDDWAYHIIRLVGSYRDMWERHLAPIGLERGANKLWSDGGVMFSLPFR